MSSHFGKQLLKGPLCENRQGEGKMIWHLGIRLILAGVTGVTQSSLLPGLPEKAQAVTQTQSFQHPFG